MKLRSSAQPPSDAALGQIVGRHFHAHAVASGEADPAFAHLATDGGEDEVLVIELDPEHGAGEDDIHATFYFNVFFHQGKIKIKKAGFGSPEPRQKCQLV